MDGISQRPVRDDSLQYKMVSVRMLHEYIIFFNLVGISTTDLPFFVVKIFAIGLLSSLLYSAVLIIA